MKPIQSFEVIDMAWVNRMRGTSQQTNTGLLKLSPSYSQPTSQTAAQSTFYQGTWSLGMFDMHNRSGGAAVLGIGVRIANHFWKAGFYVNATTTFTDDTTDAQDADANDFPLETGATNSDGVIIHSSALFNAITMNVGTADTGGSPVRALRYSNAAGTGWTDFANLFVQDGAAAAYSTGEQILAWAPPADWGKTAAALATGLPAGRYAVNLRSTTAPTTAALVNTMEVWRLYFLTEAVADNGGLNLTFGAMEFKMALEGDAIGCLFSGTANNQNRVSCLVKVAE